MLCTFRGDKDQNDISKALFNTLSSRKFVLILKLVTEILNAVNKLILIFQYQELNYPMINEYLEDTISDLQRITKKNLEIKAWYYKFNEIFVKMACNNNDFTEFKKKLYFKDY